MCSEGYCSCLCVYLLVNISTGNEGQQICLKPLHCRDPVPLLAICAMRNNARMLIYNAHYCGLEYMHDMHALRLV